MSTWDGPKPGDMITVKPLLKQRRFKMTIVRISLPVPDQNHHWAFVYGHRLRLDGTPSTAKLNSVLHPGERRELIHIDEVVHIQPGKERTQS